MDPNKPYSSFNFVITLKYLLQTSSIIPPNNYQSLINIIKEKFDLSMINKIIYYDDDEEVKISNDSDYLTFFDSVDTNGLKRIDLIITSYEEKVRRKKLLKNCSKSYYNIKNNNGETDNICINGKDDCCLLIRLL